VFVVLFC